MLDFVIIFQKWTLISIFLLLQALKIVETKAFEKYNAKIYPAKFPACSHLDYTTDEYWDCAVHQFTSNLHHQVGTCKMGPPGDPSAVVDPQLRVYGISGLRVVDCSIIPLIPASHTNSVAMMIAEKAADMIKSTWRWIKWTLINIDFTNLLKSGTWLISWSAF